jgi:hypothetical protein
VAACHENIYQGPVLTIITENGSIRTTVYHPFWVCNGRDLEARSVPRKLSPSEDQGKSLEGRWVNSHELRVGDVLIGQDGRQQRILRIEQEYETNFPVNNLTIEEFQNFAVGPDAILIHNTEGCFLDPSDIVPGNSFKIAAEGQIPRVVDLLPNVKDPKWGLRQQHLEKHFTGNNPNYSLKLIDPQGTMERWVECMSELFSRPPTNLLDNGIIDIIGTFPKADGSGVFKLGVRLSPAADGAFDLVTVLTKQ